MNLWETMARLNRLQQSRGFKIVASCVLLALAIAIIATYWVHLSSRRQAEANAAAALTPLSAPTGTSGAPAGEGATPTSAGSAAGSTPGTGVTADAEVQAAEQARAAGEAWRRFADDVTGTRFSVQTLSLGVAWGLALGLAVVWLGLGLTYLGVIALGCVTALPLVLLTKGRWNDLGWALGGGLVLGLMFSTLVQGLRALLSGSGPVFSIARNVVTEAVRMKLSLVFIFGVIAALAVLPAMLDPEGPLRYRVQAFLQYSTSGSFLLIAVLVLMLSVGSVAFEQRDKVIWQTMTKPVKAWQYVLGKWLGATGLAAVLMIASGMGIFLFTEYLRHQKAQGEVEPFVSLSSGVGVSEDRLVLESQVLAARVSERPVIPLDMDERVNEEIDRRIRAQQALYEKDPMANDPPQPAKVRTEVEKDMLQAWFSIEATQWRQFEFTGLKAAKDVARPLTLRYKINAGGNMPDQVYRVTFFVEGAAPLVREVHLDQMISMALSTEAIVVADVEQARKTLEAAKFSGSLADDPDALRRAIMNRTELASGERASLLALADELSGVLRLQVNNGDYVRRLPNPATISFPPGGLEVSYPVEGWQWNFARVLLVMILKLAFLSIVGIAAATFLSFPVAAMVALGIFISAESTGFMLKALEGYGISDNDGVKWYRILVVGISEGVVNLFRWYDELRPTESLVEGRLVSWGTVARGGLLLTTISAFMFAVGSYIFRRRELATYSGK